MKKNSIDQTILATKLLQHLEMTIQIDTNRVRFDVRFADSIPVDKGRQTEDSHLGGKLTYRLNAT